METVTDFKSFGLDPRLMKGIKKMGYTEPTLIQAEAIPLALAGKDIVARAKTGSGKTAAYCIPLMQKLLKRKDEEASLGNSSSSSGAPRLSALILVPTKELSEQVKENMDGFTHYTYKLVNVCNLCAYSIEAKNSEAAAEAGVCDVAIGTPGTVSKALELGWIDLAGLEMVVMDEADLLVSFGYEADLEGIAKRLPRICQGMLMSATLSGDVEKLKKLVLHTPVILKLTEPEAEEAQITEYTIPVESESDRFTALYAILKLRIVPGKTLIFVNDILRCFRLKLFLDKFFIKAAVLNSELPFTSRMHTVQEFNRGSFEYLIATDDSDDIEQQEEEEGSDDEEMEEEDDDDEEEEETSAKNKKVKKEVNKRGTQKEQNVSQSEYSMSRGVDFKNVAAVVNFDLPETVTSYVHRIGRTGRGTSNGIAVSFFTKQEGDFLEDLIAERKEAGHEVKPYEIKKAVLGSFRYRCEDVYRSITLKAVKAASEDELKAEVLNSEKLKEHFKENPREAGLLRGQLRHDRKLLRTRAPAELRDIPSYLLPPALGGTTASDMIEDVFVKNEDPVGMLGRKRVRHGSDLNIKKRKKKKRDGDYIPTVLGGKHSQPKKKVNLNRVFRTKRKYGKK